MWFVNHKKVLTSDSDLSKREDGVFEWGEFNGFLCGDTCIIFFVDGVDFISALNGCLIWYPVVCSSNFDGDSSN